MPQAVEFPEKFQPLFRPSRYKVYHGGRGGAKSWNFARALIIIAAQKQLRILCTRELQNSIQESVHKLLSDQIERMGYSAFYSIYNNEIRGLNGSEFIFEGLRHNTDKIKSMEGIDICWVEEADKVSENSWTVLIPTIRKPGSEIWISFNPGLKTDPTYRRFVLHPPPSAIVISVGWRDNPWFPDELRQEMEHLKATDYAAYEHVWEGKLRSIAVGAVYGKQLREAMESGRITTVPIESAEVVNTFWDLGKGRQAAVWFHQEVGLQNRFIDFYIPPAMADIDEMAKELKYRGYNYGTHYMPHDVEHQILGLGGKNRKEMFEAAGIKPVYVVPRINHVEEGIEMTRKAFASCWFDAERCEEGLDALKSYRYEYNDKNTNYRPTPLHDWASHPADAFRQFGQGYQGRGHGWAAASRKHESTSNSYRRSTRENPWASAKSDWIV